MDGGLRKWFGEIPEAINSLEYPYSRSTSGADGNSGFDGNDDDGVRVES